MKINSKDFRVREGEGVDLKKWPTRVDAVYRSKVQYEKLLKEHMAIITCPVTKQRAQVRTEEDAPAIEHADTRDVRRRGLPSVRPTALGRLQHRPSARGESRGLRSSRGVTG